MRTGYIAYSNNFKDRMQSTSGGVFYELAKYIISNGGVVYGAAFDENFSVTHIRANSIEEIQLMQGSKYAQSNKKNIYTSVREDLVEGLKVLFCGSPCEVEGLMCFLGKKFENLLCLDFVCLGIPSPQVWDEYLETFHSKKDINHINFKDKKYGWTNWTFTIYKKKGVFREPGNLNLYMQGYLQHLYIRPSCYECKFRKDVHRSDLTIADCWGIENIAPEMNDQKGVSMVLINSSKGKDYFSCIIDAFTIKEVSSDALLKGNPHATIDIIKNPNSGLFYKDKKLYGLKTALYRYAQNRKMWKFAIKTAYWRLMAFFFK